MGSKHNFKIGDIVIINAPGGTLESQHNGKKAKVVNFFGGYIGLKQDYVPGEWYVSFYWLKLSNCHIIKKRLGIK